VGVHRKREGARRRRNNIECWGSSVGPSHGNFEGLGGDVSETVGSSEMGEYSLCAGVSRVRIAGMVQLLSLFLHAREAEGSKR